MARQYEHIKDSLEDQGKSEDLADEIAARSRMTKAELERAVGGRS